MCDHSPNREAAMTVVARNEAGKPTIWCDPCIAPLIVALNTGGLATIASCCGHDEYPGWVMLTDGRSLLIAPDHHAAQRLHDLLTSPASEVRDA